MYKKNWLSITIHCTLIEGTSISNYKKKIVLLSKGNELQPEQEITQVLRQLRKLDFSREEESKEDLNMDKQKYEMVGEEQGEDKFDVFAKWLLDGGAIFPKLYLKKYSSNSRGVHASREIEVVHHFFCIFFSVFFYLWMKVINYLFIYFY